MNEISYEISALYDGGWRSTDKEEMMTTYNFTEEQANMICMVLRLLEEMSTD